MILHVLDKTLKVVGILESCESLLWVERYQEPGEFEIYDTFSYAKYQLLKEDYYLISAECKSVMIIETIKIEGTHDSGYKLIVRGRSIEGMLDRRIILRRIVIDTTLQYGIRSLLNENIISSIYPARNFPNFSFIESFDQPVQTPTLKAQYYSESLLDTIIGLLKQSGLGFKMRLNSAMTGMTFELFSGKDRTYDQTMNTFVVFSPDFDNLKSSEYLRTKTYKKTYALVSGDSTGLSFPQRVEVGGNYESGDGVGGYFLWEIFVDASDISRFVSDTSTPLDTTAYAAQLTQRGKEVLASWKPITQFEGKVELNDSYVYGTDFYLGDIVQIVDHFGHSAAAQVLEMTISENLSGRSVYPTLKTL